MTSEELAVWRYREQVFEVIQAEEECIGSMPTKLKRVSREELVRAAVRRTKHNLIQSIRFIKTDA